MPQRSFMLGKGEVLTHEVKVPRWGGEKDYPYTFDDSLNRLSIQFESASQSVAKLPDAACPGDFAVELITLHPAFIAKSYFPEAFLDAAGLEAIGSRNVSIIPEKNVGRRPKVLTSTTQLFVAGRRFSLRNVEAISATFLPDSPEAKDFRKIERVELPCPISAKVAEDHPKEDSCYEVGIHLMDSQPELIQSTFLQYAQELEIQVYFDLSFYAGGLWFLPAIADFEKIQRLSLFTFARVIRPMPHLRGLPQFRRSSSAFAKTILPTDPPVAPDIRAAILDGGLPEQHPIRPWITNYLQQDSSAIDIPEYNEHGLGVTSAFLFGPISPTAPAQRPYSPVTHIRILDSKITHEEPLELYRTLAMIEEILLSRQYQFLNLSLGPDITIEDDEVHAWTSIIDENLADGETLMTIAVGNNGDFDPFTRSDRIQVPADSVNALSVGACDSLGDKWNRASYSARGPGRNPGITKPDLLAFGGGSGNYFHVVSEGKEPSLVPNAGTSFASPFLLRTAVGIKAYLGDSISMLAIKALLIHCATPNGEPKENIGWGKAPEDIGKIIECPSTSARIVYQGELRSGKFLRAPIPLPKQPLSGKISLKATICYSSSVDPEDSGAYTRAGIEVFFRPNKDRVIDDASNAKTNSFFKRQSYATEAQLRSDFGKWETVLHAQANFNPSTLNEPCFDIHCGTRQNGRPTARTERVRYALIVTISAPKMLDISEHILEAFPQLVPLEPRISLPLKL